VLKGCTALLGDHYFIKNPVAGSTGITPVFDFRTGAKKGDSSGFVDAKKIGVSTI
jgi:hypothetical protein